MRRAYKSSFIECWSDIYAAIQQAVEQGVEGLVHVSEMSDDETVDPEKLFQLNEKKQFKVLDIDTENRKIALSLKDTKK